jgi:hypothetical protein
LRDPTGNRRFWIAEVGRTRDAELSKDVDQLWAEAEHYASKGEECNIPEELWGAAAEVAERHMKEDTIADDVCLKLSELPDTDAIVLTSDMAKAIGINDVTKRGGHIAQSMATGARQAGWSVKLDRVPGLQSKGGVRHYASPMSKDGQPILYKYSDAMPHWRPVIRAKPLQRGKATVEIPGGKRKATRSAGEKARASLH